ncbi:MAG: TIGR04211 family SH3 domain-containing protein [Acidiferrobacterales bacterium]
MKVSMVFLLWTVLLPSLVQAETVYVTDRLFVSIREGQGSEFPVVKSVATGTNLEVLQRLGGFALVREPGGAEGWIAERYLINSAPGKAELDVTRNKLKLAANEVATLKQKLADSSKRAREEKTRARALEQQLKNTGVSLQGNTGVGDNAAAMNTPGNVDSSNRNGVRPPGLHFSWLWFLISFAMLITGFIVGVIWLRELNRKKMGGMYLRI